MSEPSMKEAVRVLEHHFGYRSFRPDQERIVSQVLAGRDVLGIMPTGAGKSICYQVPALMLDGWTLVVSPLISLMHDQVTALTDAGVKAAYLNSALDAEERFNVLHDAREGAFKLLYVAPERLETPEFAQLCREMPPALVAIDEAHCISQWGQDFRPSYTRIDAFLEQLHRRPPIAAFTATATAAVRDDILAQLALDDPFVLTASFDRPNLHFAVMRPSNKMSALLRIARTHAGQCGIVYCTARKTVEEVCATLQDEGFPATRYHAGLSPEERRANQHDFIYDVSPLMVATNAFGMGIDKSDVSFIVHYNMPLDVESYYQEAGRAGRDGAAADCILLYAPRDVRTCQFLLDAGFSENSQVDAPTRQLLLHRASDRLAQMTFYSTTTDCLRAFLLRYFGEHPAPFCGNCSNCETEFEERDMTEEARKTVSCVYRLEQRGRTVGRSTIAEVLHGSKSSKIVESGLDSLSTYGLLADMPMHRIRDLIDGLVAAGHLGSAGDQYPVVVFTEASLRFLKSEKPYLVKVAHEKPEAEHASGRDGGRGQRRRNDRTGSKGYAGEEPAVMTEDDERLLEALKALRSDLAHAAGMPAYIVFNNRTLEDMCHRRPHDIDSFLDVSGVGDAKADRYGKAFLAAIAEFEDKAE